MSENENLEQIGRAVEEYSRLKGEVNHIQEKLNKCQSDFALASQLLPFLRVQDGKLIVPAQLPNQQTSLDGILNVHQLIEVLGEKERLVSDLNAATTRLKALAPNLL